MLRELANITLSWIPGLVKSSYKSVNNTSLRSETHKMEDRATIQRDLSRLKEKTNKQLHEVQQKQM